MKKNQHERRQGALARLEGQLATNQKRTKEGTLVPITEKDKTRITKEIGVVKSRL
jgi:hypothetical protein